MGAKTHLAAAEVSAAVRAVSRWLSVVLMAMVGAMAAFRDSAGEADLRPGAASRKS